MSIENKKRSSKIKMAAILSLLGVLLSFGSCAELCDHQYSQGFSVTDLGHYRVCELCGKSEDIEYHKYGDIVTDTPATDESDGEGHRECYICGYRQSETLHNYVFVDEIPASCVQNKVEAHYECTACGGFFEKRGDYYIETTLEDITLHRLSHEFDPDNAEFVKMPTLTSGGTVRFRCMNYGTLCEGYVPFGNSSEINLPKLTDTNAYSVSEGENNSVIYRLRSDYLDGLLKNRVSASGYRDRIIKALTAVKFYEDACAVKGHAYSPESFVYADNTVTYSCACHEDHDIVITLPEINETDYTKENRVRSANCLYGERTVYTLNKTWEAVLEPYQKDLESSGHTLEEYADILDEKIEFFIVKSGSVPNPDNHVTVSGLEAVSFTAPVYDVHTAAYSDGEAVFKCPFCNGEFSEVVKYGDGEWRCEGNVVQGYRYYRDYSVLYHGFTSPVRTKFKYRIDPNGGTVEDGVSLTGEMGSGFFLLFDDIFTKADSKVTGISVNVDRNTGVVAEGQIEEHLNTWYPNRGVCNYWKINIGPDYPGDLVITLKWSYV